MKRTLLFISISVVMGSCGEKGEPEFVGVELEGMKEQDTINEILVKADYDLSKADYNLAKAYFVLWRLNKTRRFGDSGVAEESKEDATRHFELSIESAPNSAYADSSNMYLDSLR